MRDCDRYLCGNDGDWWLIRLRHGDRFGPWALMNIKDDAPPITGLDQAFATAILVGACGLSKRAANAVIRASIRWADSRAYEPCV